MSWSSSLQRSDGLQRHRRLAERDLGDGTIMSRVDTLEHAVAALTRVQVRSDCKKNA
jgi:hypothetical protein